MTKAVLVALGVLMAAAGPAFAKGPGGSGGPGGHGGHFGRGGSFGHGGHAGHFGHGGHGHGPKLHTTLPTRVFPHHHFRHGFVGTWPHLGYGYGYGATYAVPTYIPYATETYSTPSSGDTPSAFQTVVELPTGRYVLQGNGVTIPYRWVWVPNPPIEEPPVAPPAPPAPPASVPGPPASAPAPVRPVEYYRWTDANGVTHLTDSIDLVPVQHRAKAKAKTQG
jgi:hypothetical protein